MKWSLPLLLIALILTGCGQSDQAKAAELVKQSCAIGNTTIEKRETLIRQAVSLDEKYRPYLIAWLNWQSGFRELPRARKISREAYEAVYQKFKDNFIIKDSYCEK